MIKIKVSQKGYKIKPTATDMIDITMGMKNYPCIYVDYREIKEYLKRGHSVLLAEFQEDSKDIFESSINCLECIALDVDSKENEITLFEMVALVNKKLGVYPVIEYPTFSDTNYTKFRLIYRLESPIDVETYKLLYKALQWKFNKYLDQATSNANRIWAGTNKEVTYRENDIPISCTLIVKLINAYQSKLKRDNKAKQKVIEKGYTQYDGEDYIKPQYKEECLNRLISSISLKDFIQKHLGGEFKYMNGNYIGRCVLHGGDNKGALVINDEKGIYTCFTHCGTGNLISVAKKVYGITNFSKVAFMLAQEYNLSIPEEWIRRVK